jgi:hypothetical protein
VSREKGPEHEHQKVEVRHAGQDEVWLESSNQPEQPEQAGAHAVGTELVDDKLRWKLLRSRSRSGHQPQMHLVLAGGEAPRQQSNHLLRSTTPEMRDEQEYPGPLGHGYISKEESIGKSILLEVLHLTNFTCTEMVHYLRFP